MSLYICLFVSNFINFLLYEFCYDKVLYHKFSYSVKSYPVLLLECLVCLYLVSVSVNIDIFSGL